MKLTEKQLQESASEARDMWLASLPDENALPKHEFSSEFEEKMLSAIECKSKHTSLPWQKALRFLGKTAAVIIFVLGVFSASVLTVVAAKGEIMSLLTHIYEKYIVFEVVDDQKTYPYQDLYPVSLGYIPDGMTVVTKNRIKNDMLNFYCINLRENTWGQNTYHDMTAYSGRLVELRQDLILPERNEYIAFETEGDLFETFTFQNFTAYISQSGGLPTIRWFDENIYYTLYGNISVEELKNIAENIIFEK